MLTAVRKVEAGDVAVQTDARLSALVGAEGWSRLPAAIRRRFSKPYTADEQRVYRGEVVLTELSWAGAVLAFLTRVIGAPLPGKHGATGAAVVIVAEDPVTRHQCWTRCYARRGRFAQVIQSAKRFQGSTGLEEYVGYGIGMTLAVGEDGGALVFRSRSYFIEALGVRLTIPKPLEPGEMEIVHARAGSDAAFSFRLTLKHPLCGVLVHQVAHFRDDAETASLPRQAALQGIARFS